MEHLPQTQASPYLTTKPYINLIGLAVILFGIAWVGLNSAEGERAQTWFQVLILMIAFSVLAGHGVTGYWRGILIDNRYKMSLSRLQLIVWTLVILSALFTIVLTNIGPNTADPLDVTIPSELWILLGISTASAVAGPAVLSSKKGRVADSQEFTKTAKDMARSGTSIDENVKEMIVCNTAPGDARWADLLKGDESGNASTIDVGKLQMFFFTFILLVGYGAAIASLLNGSDEVITKLPEVQEGMNVLLGISHTGYLANKAVSHSKEGAVNSNGGH